MDKLKQSFPLPADGFVLSQIRVFVGCLVLSFEIKLITISILTELPKNHNSDLCLYTLRLRSISF